MKSPWKFLVQLTSRGRPAEAREGSIERDAETTAIESEAEQASALPLSSTEAVDRPDHDDTPPVDLVATIRDEVRQSSADVHALVRENATRKKSPRIPQTKRPARARKARADMNAASTVTARQDQSAQSPSPLEIFFEEAVSLDEEIKQLRSQLAQKLHLQNSQLKKMLQRFDAS
uniref:Uncharacterized protein n=1 Tax=Rhizobium rhizogenes TaxID=359 RepID=A0A7S4ZRI5_RHIRH|nr:hypothetical protein [Rhizobium rhizogenes]QCL09380.1 hypothetical protein pC5.7c_513 [Rhizobium rhizogenes]QCL09550.1 hypothetical protein pC5.8a_58 [Rhizobium rhizogenes]